MSDHHHDHHDHDHSHSHGGDDHHDHDHSSDIQPALQSLLYNQIEFDKIITYNETDTGSGKAITKKTWNQRLESEPFLKSDADEQLLMIVPFAGTVRLHSLLVRTSTSLLAPKSIHLFVNKPDLDFGTASDLQPTQTVNLAQTNEIQEIPVKRALFSNAYSLALFFSENFSDGEEDVSEVFYLGFKGDFTRLAREPVEVLYEAAANPKDHVLASGIGVGIGESQLGR